MVQLASPAVRRHYAQIVSCYLPHVRRPEFVPAVGDVRAEVDAFGHRAGGPRPDRVKTGLVQAAGFADLAARYGRRRQPAV